MTLKKEFKNMSNLCPQCGAPIAANSTKCEYCGAVVAQKNAPSPQPQVVYTQQPQGVYPERANWPVKSKIAAGILALFLGGFGIHKFYLGRVGAGILYLLFCWTYIPACIAFIDAIILFCSNDENFELKYRCRTK